MLPKSKPSSDTLRLFYCPEAAGATETDLALSGDEAHHALNVLRLGPGDAVRLFDGCGRFYAATLAAVTRRAATVRIESSWASSAEPHMRLALLVALLKGRKADFLIQKAVELGVWSLEFYPAERSVARPGSPGETAGNLQRWEKIVVAACKQCGRAALMQLRSHASLAAALAAAPERAHRIVFWEDLARSQAERPSGATGPPEATRERLRADGACAAIGPEGGFAPEEIARIEAAGFRPRSLGPRILRAETAALAAATILLQAGGELGEEPLLSGTDEPKPGTPVRN